MSMLSTATDNCPSCARPSNKLGTSGFQSDALLTAPHGPAFRHDMIQESDDVFNIDLGNEL